MSDVAAFLNFLQSWAIIVAAGAVVLGTIGGIVYAIKYWKS